jgi:phage terminase small subunit
METKKLIIPTQVKTEWFESLTTVELMKYFPNRNPSAISLKEIENVFDSLDRITIHVQFHEGKEIESEKSSVDTVNTEDNKAMMDNGVKSSISEEAELAELADDIKNLSDKHKILMLHELLKYKKVRKEIVDTIFNILYKALIYDTKF